MLVVDDCSDDDVAAAVGEFGDPRVRVIRHATNRGPAAARNTGIKAARGSLIALLDSDDAWMPRKLERQVDALMASHSGGRAVVSGFVVRRIRPATADAAGRGLRRQEGMRLGLPHFAGVDATYTIERLI